jgi:hypothetical protein
VTPPPGMQKPGLQLVWALALALLAVGVAWIHGDPAWGLIVGGVILVTYALAAAVGRLPLRRPRHDRHCSS